MAKEPQSAPELPRGVAKEFGLHQEAQEAPVSHQGAEEASAQASDASSMSIVDDPKTDQAVDDIIAKESDDLLELQSREQPPALMPAQRSLWKKLRRFLAAWWENKWARWITIILFAIVLITAAIIPKSRYAMLNTLGMRSSASVQVLDNTTQLPLKNVSVTLGDKKVRTNINGVATFTGLKLGPRKLTIKRIAFAPHNQPVTIGWGSNPLGTYKLEAVGTQYSITVTDYLSGKPLEGAEAESDQGNALADKKGKLVLTVDDTDVLSLTVRIRAEGYRTETVMLNAEMALRSKQPLVPAQKTVFISKQSGTYDLYSIDLDGKNRKLLLAGTGNESGNMSLVVSSDSNKAALVSQRENIRDSGGFLLYTLTFVNIAQGTSMAIDRAQQIQPVDWLGNRLVYRSTIAGASAANPQRNRLISYNHETNARVQLAAANQFNAVTSAGGWIYYGASSTDPRATLGLFRIKSDGAARERLSEKEVWTALRSTYSSLSIQAPDGWYAHAINSKELTKAVAPPNFASYMFAEKPQGGASAWLDTRDGKGVLLLQDSGGQNKALTSQVGLTYPVHWAGEKAVVYRLVTAGETAEYAVSPNGGDPRKITDVSPVYGYAQVY